MHLPLQCFLDWPTDDRAMKMVGRTVSLKKDVAMAGGIRAGWLGVTTSIVRQSGFIQDVWSYWNRIWTIYAGGVRTARFCLVRWSMKLLLRIPRPLPGRIALMYCRTPLETSLLAIRTRRCSTSRPFWIPSNRLAVWSSNCQSSFLVACKVVQQRPLLNQSLLRPF